MEIADVSIGGTESSLRRDLANRKWGRMRSIVAGLVLILLASLAASGQDSGVITGSVRDNSGAAIPNATVTSSNESGTLSRTTVSNSDGEYSVPGLPAGTYDLTITASGFRTFEAKGVVLRVAQKSRVDATLAVGSVNESITVQGEGVAQVETESSEVAGTITGTQIAKLQMNGRVFTSLVGLQPGVADPTEGDEQQTGSFSGVSASINGGRSEYSNWQVNGGDNQDNGSNGTLVVYPNVDAISEVRVLESSYGAQYGKNGSGTVEVETKSGTKAFHGDLFYYGRNDFFNARSYFADPTAPKPSYKRHDFGYTVGGPVFIPGHYNNDKSKTFFFWAQEWRRQKDPTDYTIGVPSDAERRGDFSYTCQANPTSCPSIGSQIPIDPNSALLLALIPHANTFPTSNGVIFPTYQASVSNPTQSREELLKIDHNINSKTRATFSYIHDSYLQETPYTGWGSGSFATFGTNRKGPGVSIVARLTAQLSPTLLNEFVFGYTSNSLTFTDNGPWKRSSYPGLFANSVFPNNFGGKVSAFSVNDSNQGFGFSVDPSFAPWVNSDPTYSYRDNVSKIIGKHSLQFGAYFQAAQKNEDQGAETQGLLNFNNLGSSVTSGNGFADFLMGKIQSFYQESRQVKYYQRYKIVEAYLQDDWRIAPKLTLNLGFRASLFGTYRERYKQATNFNPNTFNSSAAPAIDPNTGAFISGSAANPFNGLVECGGPGGSAAASVPGGLFPNASVGGSPYAGCLKEHLFNPAPRIGFAYDPFGDGQMSIRGGYGIFYEHTNGTEGNTEGLEGNPPQFLNVTQTNINGFANIGGGGSGLQLFPSSDISIPNKAVWPYIQQWHFDVQKAIPGKTVLVVAYVGSKGTHLTTQRDMNQLYPLPLSQNPYKPGEAIGPNDCSTGTTPSGVQVTGQALIHLNVACGADPTVAGYRPFAAYNSIFRFDPAASSIYHSLQVSARRTTGSLTYSLAYTYSHSIDNASKRADEGIVNGYDPASARASSNFDQRHILNLSYFYELPFFKGKGARQALLGGWALSGITLLQTGQPFSVGYGNDNAGVKNGNGVGSFLDLVGNPHSPSAVKQYNGKPVLFNPAAFAIPRGLTFGNSGRNSLTYPFRTNFDLALFKSFLVGEAKAFEFRWEAFNVFNHHQFNAVDTTITDPGFLAPTGGHSSRIVQYSLKFIF